MQRYTFAYEYDENNQPAYYGDNIGDWCAWEDVEPLQKRVQELEEVIRAHRDFFHSHGFRNELSVDKCLLSVLTEED